MSAEEKRFLWSTHRTFNATALRVRITLCKDQDLIRQEGDGELVPDGANIFQREFRWQERLFSHNEVRSHRENSDIGPKADISREYRAFLDRKLQEDPNYSGETLFTRVPRDQYTDISEIDKPVGFTVGERDPTELAEAVLRGWGDEDLVDVVQTSIQSMHFFASVPIAEGQYHEELLGVVRIFQSGRIDVRPPFSNKTNPVQSYKFITPNHDCWYYRIDVIEDRKEDKSPFERTLDLDIRRRRVIFVPGGDSSLAEVPDGRKVRMFYRGEIETCEMDDVDSVAVDYAVRFPHGWCLEDPQKPVAGSSQLAVCNEHGVAHINMPLEFVATCETQLAPVLEVVLHTYTDSKARLTVGYGTCPLPVEKGCHKMVFDTWRIRGSIVEELRLQFLDSGLEIQPNVEQGLSRTENEDVNQAVNKFALHTVGTGKVTVRMNLAQQSSLFQVKEPMQAMSTLGSISRREPSRMSSRMSELPNV